MLDVISSRDILEKQAAASVTRNTNTYVNTFSPLMNTTRYSWLAAEPDVCWTGGSWKESHSLLSWWTLRRLEKKQSFKC